MKQTREVNLDPNSRDGAFNLGLMGVGYPKTGIYRGAWVAGEDIYCARLKNDASRLGFAKPTFAKLVARSAQSVKVVPKMARSLDFGDNCSRCPTGKMQIDHDRPSIIYCAECGLLAVRPRS
jgi:hypothetical protein